MLLHLHYCRLIKLQSPSRDSSTTVEKMTNLSLFLGFFFLLFPILSLCSPHLNHRQVYIVYLGEHTEEKTEQDIEDGHYSFLLSVKNSEEEARASLLYSYKRSINGFAALLTEDEAAKLSDNDEVVSAFPSRGNGFLATTRSWDFVSLEEGLFSWQENIGSKHRANKRSQDVIVGVLDSGVWPESHSFNDKEMGPIPEKWKGICEEGDSFNSSHCNRKIIGARYYIKNYESYYGHLDTTMDYRSPRDRDGHGTHTSSTVGGRRVRGVTALGGFARGTASGGAPLVRLAIYKVCWPLPGAEPAEGNTCFDADMLAAMDDAVGDGVDLISMSIVKGLPAPDYASDAIAIGALHAAKRNVVVACSAGNLGPGPATLSNLAPWILTVGASSIDRMFLSPILLGNGMEIEGESVAPHEMDNKQHPLVFAADVVVSDQPQNATGQCLPGSLDPKKTKGKIVVCLRGAGTRVGKGMEVKRAGGAGFILGNIQANAEEIVVDAHVLPAAAVGYEDILTILNYINSTKNPTASIAPAKTIIPTRPAPFMASFSSAGPNALDPYILKPDITAPGLNILAAWSEASSPSKLLADHRHANYNFQSGTSMSCPHAAAAAALLKAIHPRWSAAAIRSALMTTASVMNNEGQPITNASGNVAGPFNYGSGHIRPMHAADPGLVYDASYTDYLIYACSLGFHLDPSFDCPTKPILPANLNHPSVAIPNLNGTLTVTRTLMSVSKRKSIYRVSVSPPPGTLVEITPRTLSFNGLNSRQSFYITVRADEVIKKPERGEYVFGWFAWSDGAHYVRCPLVVSLF